MQLLIVTRLPGWQALRAAAGRFASDTPISGRHLGHRMGFLQAMETPDLTAPELQSYSLDGSQRVSRRPTETVVALFRAVIGRARSSARHSIQYAGTGPRLSVDWRHSPRGRRLVERCGNTESFRRLAAVVLAGNGRRAIWHHGPANCGPPRAAGVAVHRRMCPADTQCDGPLRFRPHCCCWGSMAMWVNCPSCRSYLDDERLCQASGSAAATPGFEARSPRCSLARRLADVGP